jgi:hypothetical protein
MKALPTLFLGAAAVLLSAAAADEKRPIAYSDLSTTPVIGALGLPLGEIARVEGAYVEGKTKADVGLLLLRVDKLNGRALDKPVVLRRGGEEPVPATKAGQRFKLLGYETGGFVGAPKDLFKYVKPFTVVGFYFQVHFEVINSVDHGHSDI